MNAPTKIETEAEFRARVVGASEVAAPNPKTPKLSEER